MIPGKGTKTKAGTHNWKPVSDTGLDICLCNAEMAIEYGLPFLFLYYRVNISDSPWHVVEN